MKDVVTHAQLKNGVYRLGEFIRTQRELKIPDHDTNPVLHHFGQAFKSGIEEVEDKFRSLGLHEVEWGDDESNAEKT